MKLSSLVDHNDFNPAKYPNDNHNIVDIEISDKILIECTNPKPSTEMNDSIMLNKLDYFHRKDPLHLLIWVLLVSFANFSEFILNKIKELNIILIELKVRADEFSNRHVVKQLFKSKLYSLIKRFKSTIYKTKKIAPILGNNLISKYVNTVHTATVNNSNVKHTTLHQHCNDTKIMQEDDEIFDKWEVSKAIERAKKLGLFTDYGFSS